MLFDRIAELGGKPLMWKTGHSLIKSKMKETGAPLAGEMSGHIFFKHRWYGFDDALYAAVRLIEAVSASGKSLTEIMDAMPKSVATPELRFQVDESAQVRDRRGSPRPPVRRRRQGRRDRRRPRQHRRRLVAAPRLEHAGRAGRARGGGRTRRASTGSSRRSTTSWRSQASSASKRRTDGPGRSLLNSNTGRAQSSQSRQTKRRHGPEAGRWKVARSGLSVEPGRFDCRCKRWRQRRRELPPGMFAVRTRQARERFGACCTATRPASSRSIGRRTRVAAYRGRATSAHDAERKGCPRSPARSLQQSARTGSGSCCR